MPVPEGSDHGVGSTASSPGRIRAPRRGLSVLWQRLQNLCTAFEFVSRHCGTELLGLPGYS